MTLYYINALIFFVLNRYTMPYAIILLIHIALSPYFGQNSPLYPKNGSEPSECQRTWWHNLLYINNFFDMYKSCMGVCNNIHFRLFQLSVFRLRGFWP